MLPTGVAMTCYHALLQYRWLYFLCCTLHHHDSYTYSWSLFLAHSEISWKQFKSLSLSINLLGGTRAVLSVGWTVPCYWAPGRLCTLPHSLCILRCFSRPAEALFLACVWAGAVILNPFGSFPNRHGLINTQLSIWGALLWVTGITALFSSLLFPRHSPCLG